MAKNNQVSKKEMREFVKQAKVWVQQQQGLIDENKEHITYYRKLMKNFIKRIVLLKKESEMVAQNTKEYIRDNKLKIKFRS